MKRPALLLVGFIAISFLTCSKVDESAFPANREKEIEFRQNKLTHQLITPCEALTLKYFIDPSCLNSQWQTAIAGTITAYNKLLSTIKLTEVSSITSAHIIFDCTDTAPGLGSTCGSGKVSDPQGSSSESTYFPSGGSVSKYVYLRKNHSSCPCGNNYGICNYENENMPCVYQRTVMHELGHALGIAHNSNTIFDAIPGTPAQVWIPNSVFNDHIQVDLHCEYCHPNCQFSHYDSIALKYLYPLCLKDPSISVLFDPCNDIFYLQEHANPRTIRDCTTQFNWTLSGLASPPLMTNGVNNAQVRVPYSAGQKICVEVSVINECIGDCYNEDCRAASSTPCKVCFIAPACDGFGGLIEGEIANDCSSFNPCPPGFDCINGICCQNFNGHPCETNLDCPSGFICVDGECVDIR